MVIDAAKILKDRGVDVDFWILGVGSQEKQLKEQLMQAGCEDMVHFLGYQSNPYPYMRAADMYLSSSYAEGLPLVLCEAQCLGKPILATKTIGAIELLKDSTRSEIVEISCQAIVDAITKAVVNKWYLSNDNKISMKRNAMDILELINTNILN